MSWVRLDDGFADKPEMVKAGPLATMVAIWALCHSSRHLTDGHVARESLLGCTWVASKSQRHRAIGRLIVAGFWVESGDGFDIVDPFQYLQESAVVKEKRRQNAERQARWREKQRAAHNGASNGVTEDGRNAPPDPTLPRKGEDLYRDDARNARGKDPYAGYDRG